MRHLFIHCLVLLLLIPLSSHAMTIDEVAPSNPTTPMAWLVEEPHLPVISMKFAFTHRGAAYDNKPGTAYLANHMFDEGAGTYDQLRFNKALEERAIYLWFEVNQDDLIVHIKTLKEHIEPALALMRTALMEPHFAEENLTRIKTQIIAMIEKQEERPEHIAQTRWQKEAFGNHPYARPVYGSKKAIKTISADDLRAYMDNTIGKAEMKIAVVGDINQKELSTLLDRYITGLGVRTATPPSLKEAHLNTERKTIHIDRTIPQAIAIFGFEGIKRSDPDFYPIYLLNYVLGGGSFESRLMKEVREKRGLAYSVYSYLDTKRHAGTFKGYVATEAVNIGKSLALINEVIRDAKEDSISDQELEEAKSYLIGSLPIQLSKNDTLASYLLNMQLEGLERDFLDKRNNLIQKVTPDDIERVAKTFLTPEHMLTVVVGGELQGAR